MGAFRNKAFFAIFSVKFHPVAGAPRGDGIEAGLDV